MTMKEDEAIRKWLYGDMGKKKRMYIATPVNARSEATLDLKREAAHRRCVGLKAVLEIDFPDWEIVTPFDVTRHFGEVVEAEAMGACITLLLTCDAIYLDRGWTASKGCNLEYRAAKIYGLAIMDHNKM